MPTERFTLTTTPANTIITGSTRTRTPISTEPPTRTHTATTTIVTTQTTSTRMPRKAGTGKLGRVRSFRLPHELDAWLQERIEKSPATEPASDIILNLLHGGLRLKRGYMTAHRNDLIAFVIKNDREGYATYCAALRETFEAPYVHHLEEWLKAEGFEPAW